MVYRDCGDQTYIRGGTRLKRAGPFDGLGGFVVNLFFSGNPSGLTSDRVAKTKSKELRPCLVALVSCLLRVRKTPRLAYGFPPALDDATTMFSCVE